MRDTRQGTAGGYVKQHQGPFGAPVTRYRAFKPDYGKAYGLPVTVPISHVPASRAQIRSKNTAAKAVRRVTLTQRGKAGGRNQHAPGVNKGHGGNTNAPANVGPNNQSYGPPLGNDLLPPGVETSLASKPAMEDPTAGLTQTLLDPNRFAEIQAGSEFDPAIYDTRVQAAKQEAQAPQNQADIAAMFAKVQDSQRAAAQQNAAAATSAAGSQDALVQGLVASLGGAANPGAPGVAQAGVDASALMRNLGTIQAGTDANIGTALVGQQADQQLQQQRLDQSRAADLAAQLTGLRGQRGGAVAKARLDAIGQNNQGKQTNFENAQHIAEQNIANQQQDFQNRIAAQNAIIAARAAGDEHTAKALEIAYAQQYPSQVFGKSGRTGARGHTVTPSDINRAVKTAQSNLLVSVKDPSHPHQPARNILDPRLQHNVKALVAAVNSGFAGLHSNNKAALAARNRILKMYGVTPQKGWTF